MDPRQATLESRTRAHERARTSHGGEEREAAEPLFPIGLRGYDRQAVDEYVERIERYVAELGAADPRQTAVREALDEVGEQTSSILQHAHETAERITAEANAEADARLAEAEHAARRTRGEAEAAVRRLVKDTENVWRQRTALLEDMRSLAESLLEVADSASERLPEQPTLTTSVDDVQAMAPPPPPPPPGEETTLPPPPDPIADEEHAFDDGDGLDHPQASDEEYQESRDAEPDDTAEHERLVPPPDRAAELNRPTEAMERIELDDEPPAGTFRAFRGPNVGSRWSS